MIINRNSNITVDNLKQFSKFLFVKINKRRENLYTMFFSRNVRMHRRINNVISQGNNFDEKK